LYTGALTAITAVTAVVPAVLGEGRKFETKMEMWSLQAYI